MTRSINLVDALKVHLRKSGITYLDLASKLSLSQSAVKQMFAQGNFSLNRLDEICHALEIDLDDLMDLTHQQRLQIARLEHTQEQELVTDIRLLLMAYCLVNHWTVAEITTRYNIDELLTIQLLAKLDRMGLIDLLPGNRVRLRISPNFKWIRNGPIERFFTDQVQGEFLNADFNLDGSLRVVKNADITTRSQTILAERMQAVAHLFDEITHSERRIPHQQKYGTTMILAIRPWVFNTFKALER
ncbi:MAG: DNA-binding Xre family transcriptional regulator [Parasphingorhabdus sp.]|jgi:DNA-binding Xre family transcriptional regulator